MKTVATPVPPWLISRELGRLPACQTLLDDGRYAVITFRADQAPSLMFEVGRLREVCFRKVGEGTGESVDVDRFDASYTQLVAVDRSTASVIGGYRVARMDQHIRAAGPGTLYSSSLFEYHPELVDQLMCSAELGRSFVAPRWQRSLRGLPLLWRGVGRWLSTQEGCTALMGPVSLDRNYSDFTLEAIIGFLWRHHGLENAHKLVRPRTPYVVEGQSFVVGSHIEDVAALDAWVKGREGRGIPVLLRQYLKLGAKVLGFNVDPDFQDCLDVLIRVELAQVGTTQRERYLSDPVLRAAPVM